MLRSPNVNVSNIMRVIESIKADDEFTMTLWDHCICGHCHRVMGNIYRNDDSLKALEFLGVPTEGSMAFQLFHNNNNRDKDWALNTLHSLIAFDAVPSGVE